MSGTRVRWKQLPLIYAFVLIPLGCFQFFFAWQYEDAAKREVSTVGTITRVYHGKGATYYYEFPVNGVYVQDDSGNCTTPISPLGCKEGGSVLVYYDPDHLSLSKLQEFHEASREKLTFGEWAAGIGLLLLALHFLIKWNDKTDSDDSQDTDADADKPDEESEMLHITPDR
jgi:hypothetical protein